MKIYVITHVNVYTSDDGSYTSIHSPKFAYMDESAAEKVRESLGAGWLLEEIELIDAEWTTQPKHSSGAYVTPIKRGDSNND